MEYTQKFLIDKISELEEKLKRVEHLAFLTDINNDLKISMIRGALRPE